MICGHGAPIDSSVPWGLGGATIDRSTVTEEHATPSGHGGDGRLSRASVLKHRFHIVLPFTLVQFGLEREISIMLS